MKTFHSICNEKPEPMMQDMISYLEKIQKSLPKVIAELKKDNVTSTGSGLIHNMAKISNNDFYDHFFG
jgi:hypothetical protein